MTDATKIFLFEFGIFGFTNILIFIIYKMKPKLLGVIGSIMLFLSPLVWYVSLKFSGQFDEGGFGSSVVVMLCGFLFLVNGYIVIAIRAFLIK